MIHVPNTWYMEAQGAFAQALSERSIRRPVLLLQQRRRGQRGGDQAGPGYGHASGRYKIVTMEGGFHGRTYAALTATAQPKYHAGFEPMVPGFSYVPYNDLDAVAARSTTRPPPSWSSRSRAKGASTSRRPDYLKGLRKLCDERGVLLILDEVQTGMGRTGEWFAYQHYGIEPDILTCAKALAGGVAAGVMIATPRGRRDVPAGDARQHLRRQPDRLPGGPGDDRDDRAGGPARARPADRRAVPRATSRRCAAELPDLIRDIRDPGGDDRTRADGRRHGRRRRLHGAPAPGQCHARHTSIRLLPALTIRDDQIDEGCAILADVLRADRRSRPDPRFAASANARMLLR